METEKRPFAAAPVRQFVAGTAAPLASDHEQFAARRGTSGADKDGPSAISLENSECLAALSRKQVREPAETEAHRHGRNVHCLDQQVTHRPSIACPFIQPLAEPGSLLVVSLHDQWVD